MKITKTVDGREPVRGRGIHNNIEDEVVFTPEVWASIVASMCPDREQKGSWDVALALQRKGIAGIAEYLTSPGWHHLAVRDGDVYLDGEKKG